MISVSDVVDLIIDKKVKELEALKKEEDDNLIKLSNERDNLIEIFYKNLFDNHFENYNHEAIDSLDVFDIDIHLTMCGLVPKGFNDIDNKIEATEAKCCEITNKIYAIITSKDKLIAEVTLQRLSSIDVDFKENIEKLTDKIFNNLPKSIN